MTQRALDWTMREATADKRRGIQWNFTAVLEDLDFAGNIALLSSKISDLQEKTGRLADEAARNRNRNRNRNRKENQDTPIQDLSSTGPAIWL